MNPFTTKSCVLGHIRAMGPLTFDEILAEVRDQVPPPIAQWDSKQATVCAINELAKEGLIELYDTGDAWV